MPTHVYNTRNGDFYVITKGMPHEAVRVGVGDTVEAALVDRTATAHQSAEKWPRERDIEVIGQVVDAKLDISDGAWAEAASMLQGAVGDVVRKVADRLWRDKMDLFISKHPTEAEEVSTWLQTLAPEGDIFTTSALNRETRRALHSKLRAATVSDNDLLSATRAILTNPAIRGEIEDAVDSYARAKSFVEGLSQ